MDPRECEASSGTAKPGWPETWPPGGDWRLRCVREDTLKKHGTAREKDPYARVSPALSNTARSGRPRAAAPCASRGSAPRRTGRPERWRPTPDVARTVPASRQASSRDARKRSSVMLIGVFFFGFFFCF
jgi:hypothetical protein